MWAVSDIAVSASGRRGVRPVVAVNRLPGNYAILAMTELLQCLSKPWPWGCSQAGSVAAAVTRMCSKPEQPRAAPEIGRDLIKYV